MQKKEGVKTSSTARRINREFVGRQFSSYFWMDIVVALMALVCWWIPVEVNVFGFLIICLAVVIVMQIFSLLRNLLFGAKRVRYQMRTLNELAKKAEELSSIAFDESKFHLLEDAISHMDPENETEHLHIGDKDFQGLELAINRLLDRMRESYRQQSRFVSDASHELRTPISVIQGYVNMLDRWGKEDETVLEEGISAIKHESEHMSTLVEQLLFLARSDSGRHQLVREKVSLRELMREVYEEFVMIDSDHDYSFRELAEGEPGDIMVMGDPIMLKQTMRILADNARKYTKAQDEIIFATGMQEEIPFFYVQDTGIGMMEQDISHIFERFYRSEEVRGSEAGGSGLGLSIAKWIVDKHKGYFEILSREGLGTRIIVRLP
ncbi:MAG: HAMP domain-containing histidine kinase [Eubacterium sp.]|nr:HAMP domain-containing histidine kinase [Eubacterium sp.]